MTLAAFLLPLAIAVALIPVWLLRRPRLSEHEYFVASQPTRPEVVRNASIAYALRMAALGPLFVAGVNGDLWPAIVVSASFGLGVYAIYLVRKPLLEFLDGALGGDRSITIHAFIARQHGNDPRVQRLTAG